MTADQRRIVQLERALKLMARFGMVTTHIDAGMDDFTRWHEALTTERTRYRWRDVTAKDVDLALRRAGIIAPRE